VESNINDLVIINPPDSAFEFIMGESRVLKYQLHNTGEFPVKDINVRANSILKLGDDSDPTRGQYVSIVKCPKELKPGQKGDLFVKATVPSDYNETVLRDGKKILWPYRVAMTVKCIRHISEI
jgi:hypothetical protein